MAAPSLFDGTWRPDPQRPGPDAPPEQLSLRNGFYECASCDPPYRIPADGQVHPVDGNPRFDTIAVTVVDADSVTVQAPVPVQPPDQPAKVELASGVAVSATTGGPAGE